MTTHSPACARCAYKLATQEAAVLLLRSIIKVAHFERRGGATFIEAKLDPDTELGLCIIEAECEECEEGHDATDNSAEHYEEDEDPGC